MMNVSSPYGVGGLSIFLVSLLGWACSRVEPYDPSIDVAEMTVSESTTVVAATELAPAEAGAIESSASGSVTETAKNARTKIEDIATAAKQTISEKVADVKAAVPAMEAEAADLAKSAGEAVAGEVAVVKESLEKAGVEAGAVKDDALKAVAETAKTAEAKIEDAAKNAEAMIASEPVVKDVAKAAGNAVATDSTAAKDEAKDGMAATAPVDAVATPPAAKPWVGAKLGDDQPIVGVIVDDSPAATAGLKAGDVIESVNGKKVANTKELVGKIIASKPGYKLELVVTRGSESVPIALTLGTNPGTPTVAPAK